MKKKKKTKKLWMVLWRDVYAIRSGLLGGWSGSFVLESRREAIERRDRWKRAVSADSRCQYIIRSVEVPR